MLRLIIIWVVYVASESESAKILGVFPTPLLSHQAVFRSLMIELAKRGHEVTVITAYPAFPRGQAPQNLTEIDVHDVSIKIVRNFMMEHGLVKDQIKFMELMCKTLTNLIEEEIKSVQIQNFLKQDKKFDLLIVESWLRQALIFSHIFKTPIIEFSSHSAMFSTFDFIGAATHPIIYPNPMHKKIYNLTMWEKITQYYIRNRSMQLYKEQVHYENDVFRKMFGPDTPCLNELAKNIQMLFLNVNPLWDFNRPTPTSVLYLGGMHQKSRSELPQEWKSYLDSSKNGVIYVSFGTTVKSSMLPKDKLKIFINVFSQLSYDVLWKWDENELPGHSENIKISKWLPQSDLLTHPKIKLFITQGGLQSTDEALSAGVPLIGVPIHGDQWLNVANYVKFNIGKNIDMATFTENELKDAIKTVIDDKSYRENIVKLHNAVRDESLSSLERAVWWTEHVLRHEGAAHLHAPSANMSWSEYYELELVVLVIVTTVIALIVAVLTLRFIVSVIKKKLRVRTRTPNSMKSAIRF